MAAVILRKTREKRVQSGHPWIYQTEIERVDDPEGELQPGDIVRVCNSNGAFLCKALYNPVSMITLRVLTTRDEPTDEDFFRRRIQAAWDYRRRFCDENSCRLIYGESDFLPALIVDKFADVLVVQLLHFATPLMPYNFYCRNWDFGYGHYNGFGARLAGVAFAWGWLRHDRMRALDWMGLAALAIFTYKVPGSRGAFGGMAVMLGLFLVQKFFPKLFDNKIWYALVLAVPVGLAVFSLYAGYIYDPVWPYDHMAILLLSIFLSGRFEIWHNVFWGSPLTLLGGLPTDGDEHHAIDNTFLAVPMNKGLLGAALVAVFFLLLLWRLAKKHRSNEMICLLALTLYLFMENKPFLLSANPFLLLAPVVFFGSGEKTQEKE